MEDPIEQTETMEDSTELVLYRTLFYFLKKNYYMFRLQYKIQNASHYLNASHNIIK